MAFDEFKETTDQVIKKNILFLRRLPLLQTPRHSEFLEKLYDGYSKVKQRKNKSIFHPYLDGEYSYPSVIDDIHFSNFNL